MPTPVLPVSALVTMGVIAVLTLIMGIRVLRWRNGKVAVTDGPFAETKEVLGGFYVIEAASMDEALEWARRIPMGRGSIEVRPMWS